MKAKIIISAGGTGGHIFPALAVAKQLQELYEIIWVGAINGLEQKLVPKHNYQLELLNIAGVRNKGLLRKLYLPFELIYALIQALMIMLKHKPKAVLTFGGYATFPIGLSAWLMRAPLLIHEQNSVAGLTNRVLAKFARKVLSAFPMVLVSSKTLLVGNPVREEIAALGEHDGDLEINNTQLNILVVGGSLGAKVLNDVVPAALAKVNLKIAAITHQVGRGDINSVLKSYTDNNLNAKVVNFIDDMAKEYARANLVICRAGASTVAEIAAAGKLAIFIPYPYAVDDHQTTNAQYLVAQNAGFLIQQQDLSADSLAQLINGIDLTAYSRMSDKARNLALPQATAQISQQVIACIVKK